MMAVDFEKLLNSVWPDWQMVEPIDVSDDTTVYKAKRQDIVGVSEAAISVTAIPAELDEIDNLKISGLSDDAVRLHLEQLVRENVQSIQVLEAVKGDANIQRIEDYKIIRNEKTGQWFVIVRMELLTPLRKRLQLAPFTEEDIIRLGLDVCSAMERCHRSNIVHMNIEPGSIFVSKEGRYKLGGFGRARYLMNMPPASSVMLQQNYTAPEVYKRMRASLDIDAYARMDIYSLGIVMYYLANNRKPPFIPQGKQIVSPAEREAAFERRISGEPLPGLTQVSQKTAAVILRACAFRMEDRYASAAEMRMALLKLVNQSEPVQQPEMNQHVSPVQTAPGMTAQITMERVSPMLISMEELVGKPVQKKRKRGKWGKAILCVLIALVLAAAGYGVVHCNQADEDAAHPAGEAGEVVTDGDAGAIPGPGNPNAPMHVIITADGDGGPVYSDRFTGRTGSVPAAMSAAVHQL